MLIVHNLKRDEIVKHIKIIYLILAITVIVASFMGLIGYEIFNSTFVIFLLAILNMINAYEMFRFGKKKEAYFSVFASVFILLVIVIRLFMY